MVELIKLSEIFDYHPYGTQHEGDAPLPTLPAGLRISLPQLDDDEVFQVIEQRGIGIIDPTIERSTLLQLVLDQLHCFYETVRQEERLLYILSRLSEEEHNERWKSFFEKYEPCFLEFK